MKMEKLTENKIRIIVNSEDLDKNNTDLHSLMTKAIETQGLFYEMLAKAEKELGFHTEGCKLLIEAFSSIDGILVFTITKYHADEANSSSLIPAAVPPKKKLKVKRKSSNIMNKQLIYNFSTFDEFCEFCNCINNNKSFDIKQFSKNLSLYLYNDTYYLIVKDVVTNYKHVAFFHLMGAEFGRYMSYSETFENKLIERGKVIIKKNAFKTGLKAFGYNK